MFNLEGLGGEISSKISCVSCHMVDCFNICGGLMMTVEIVNEQTLCRAGTSVDCSFCIVGASERFFELIEVGNGAFVYACAIPGVIMP